MSVHDFKDNALLDPPSNPSATTETENNLLICQRSGFKIPVAEGLVKDGERGGLMVRKQDYDPIQPARFVRSLPESERGSPSPEQADRFPDPITPDDL